MRDRRNIGRFANLLTMTGFIAMPLAWIPLLVIGPTVLEIPNAASIAFLLILPFAIMVSRRMTHIHLIFGLLVLWSVLFFGAMHLHGTLDGLKVQQKQIMETAFGWTLAISIAHSDIRLHRVGFWALVSVLVALEFSALMMHVDLIYGILQYLTTGNRSAMLYGAMRPSFNAFVKTDSDVSYVASQINAFANYIILFSLLTFMQDTDTNRGPSLVAKAAGVFGLLFGIVLFSSSGVLVILAFGSAFFLRILRSAPPATRILVPLACISVVIILSGPLIDFLSVNVGDDDGSRNSRLHQYAYALNAISSHALFGIGFFLIDDNPVHNWTLFSWSVAGLFPFLVVIGVYLLVAAYGIRAARYVGESWPVILGLGVMVFVRTSVGGGGGIPAGPAIGALAAILGILERHRRLAREGLRHPPGVPPAPSMRPDDHTPSSGAGEWHGAEGSAREASFRRPTNTGSA